MASNAVERFKETKSQFDYKVFKIQQEAQKKLDRASDDFVDSMVNQANDFTLGDIKALCLDDDVSYEDKIAVTMAWCLLHGYDVLHGYDAVQIISDGSIASDDIKHIFRMVNMALEKLEKMC